MNRKNKLGYIAIEGNIGAGKTTFANEISRLAGFDLLLERFEENPFLKDFYENRDKFAFDTEMFFLNDRLEQVQSHFGKKSSVCTIADFSVFKSIIFSNITLNNEQKGEFNWLFNEKILHIKRPDLIIHIRNEPVEMKDRILKRGREYEKGINKNYLEEIEMAYDSFWESHPELNVLQIRSGQLQYPYKDEEILKLVKYLETTEIKGFNHLDGGSPS